MNFSRKLLLLLCLPINIISMQSGQKKKLKVRDITQLKNFTEKHAELQKENEEAYHQGQLKESSWKKEDTGKWTDDSDNTVKKLNQPTKTFLINYKNLTDEADIKDDIDEILTKQNLTDEEHEFIMFLQNDHATKIQALFRSFSTRKKIKQEIVDLDNNIKIFSQSDKGKKYIEPSLRKKISASEILTNQEKNKIKKMMEVAQDEANYESDNDHQDEDRLRFQPNSCIFKDPAEMIYNGILIDFPTWLLGNFGYLTQYKKLKLYKQYHVEQYSMPIDRMQQIIEAQSLQEIDTIMDNIKSSKNQ